MELVKNYKGNPSVLFGVLYFEKSYFILNGVKYIIVGVTSQPYNIHFKSDGDNKIFTRNEMQLRKAFNI